MTKRNRSVGNGMRLWQAKDAYWAHTVLLTMFYLPQFFLVLFALSSAFQGLWARAAINILAVALIWGARWGVSRLTRWVWRALRGQVRGVGLLFLCGVALSGCAEYGYRMSEFTGFNCRPATMQQYGSCTSTAQRGTP